MDFRGRKAWFQLIEVDHLPLTTFSWLPPLLLSTIGNIRQGLLNPPGTTPGVEEFLSSRSWFGFYTTPGLLHGTADHGTWSHYKLSGISALP